VPLDTRHHYFKKTPKFPEEWKMTNQRANELARYRQQLAERDQQKELAGKLIDGIKQIEASIAAAVVPEQGALPEMVMAGRGSKGKAPKRLAVRR
jgi:small subunit ribosomal protein S35